MKTLRIGCGSGCCIDRIEPAVELIERGNIDYLVFETLSERTIALANKEKFNNSGLGYNCLLGKRMDMVLEKAIKNNVKIITNMGAANVPGAVKLVKKIAESKNLNDIKVVGIIGDDLYTSIDKYYYNDILELDNKLSSISDKIISCNVYLGIEGILKALKEEADVVITGRVADPSLFLAPLVYEFNWEMDNPVVIGQGTLMGHLLECGGQITGGYFSNKGDKKLQDLHLLGFPIAEIRENGEFFITKVDGTGGEVSLRTCKEQLLYEIQDPSNYITPDAIVDFSHVEIFEVSKNKIGFSGAVSKGKPSKLKASVGYRSCIIGEGGISYSGHDALDRAQLANDIIMKRLDIVKPEYIEINSSFIGFNSMFQYESNEKPMEVRLRISGKFKDEYNAKLLTNEIDSMYTNGPYGGGGISTKIEELVSTCSIYVPREDINIKIIN